MFPGKGEKMSGIANFTKELYFFYLNNETTKSF